MESSSDSEHSHAKKARKAKEKGKEPASSKSRKKGSRASTWDMLAYLWPVSSRPAHLQDEDEVNRYGTLLTESRN